MFPFEWRNGNNVPELKIRRFRGTLRNRPISTRGRCSHVSQCPAERIRPPYPRCVASVPFEVALVPSQGRSPHGHDTNNRHALPGHRPQVVAIATWRQQLHRCASNAAGELVPPPGFTAVAEDACDAPRWLSNTGAARIVCAVSHGGVAACASSAALRPCSR